MASVTFRDGFTVDDTGGQFGLANGGHRLRFVPALSHAVDVALESKNWASLLGSVVFDGEYSAKEYSVGTVAPAGSAKSWSTVVGVPVAGGEYSAKEYAQGTVVPTGSAKRWAISTTPVDGFESSRTYATQAATTLTTINGQALQVSNNLALTAENVVKTNDSVQRANTARIQAEQAVTAANALLSSSDLIKIYQTYNQALTALPTLTDGLVVKVILDENQGNNTSYYLVDRADNISIDANFSSESYQLGNATDRLVLLRTERANSTYVSYASMLADAANLFDGQRVLVLADETNFGMGSYYTVDKQDDQTLGLNFLTGSYAIGSSVDSYVFGGGAFNTNALEYNLFSNTTNTIFTFVVNGNAVRVDSDTVGFRIRQATGTAGATAALQEHLRVSLAGNQLTFQPAESPQNTSATLSIAQLQSRIITSNAAVTLTLPTGTALEGYATAMEVNTSFEVTFIATAANAITIAANGNTTVGSLTVAANSSGTFRFRKTALNTFTVYRVA